MKEQCAVYQQRRDALCGGLRSIGWDVPDSHGSMFVWAPIPPKYTSSMDFCMDLVEKSGVLCTPGSSFGPAGEGYVRFALTMPAAQIDQAVQASGTAASWHNRFFPLLRKGRVFFCRGLKHSVLPIRLTGRSGCEAKAQAGPLAGGETPLWETLYDAFWDKLVRYCCRLTRDESLAEDLAQEAFLRAMSRRSELAGLTAHQQKSWLFEDGPQPVCDQMRRKAKEQQLLERYAPAGAEPEDSAAAAGAAGCGAGLCAEQTAPARRHPVFFCGTTRAIRSRAGPDDRPARRHHTHPAVPRPKSTATSPEGGLTYGKETDHRYHVL